MPRWLDRWAPWIAGAVLVAGIVVFAVGRLTSGGSSAAARPVPLSPEARAVAREFVDTAVARRRLGRSYDLVGPALKQGMSRTEWEGGTIPVVPYPVSESVARFRVNGSYTDHALLEVDFYPRPKSTAKAGAFTLGLEKLAGRWLVAEWAPRTAVGARGGK